MTDLLTAVIFVVIVLAPSYFATARTSRPAAA